jgi:hypothetical protein
VKAVDGIGVTIGRQETRDQVGALGSRQDDDLKPLVIILLVARNLATVRYIAHRTR